MPTPPAPDSVPRTVAAGARPPLISFGIPAYNRPELLAETLASLAAQSGDDFEVIVCDDGGLPGTAAAVARHPADRFHYYRNERRLGPVGNWNECLRRARGRWVMVLHEDDTLYPWYLDLVRPELRDGVAAVCTKTATGETAPRLERPAAPAAPRDYPPRHFLKSSMTPFPGVLIARDIATRLGGFDERAGPLADYEFWYRLAQAGPVKVVPVVGAFYRVGPDQWTARAWPEMIRLTHLLRLRIAREQFGPGRRGRWFARFFTYRNALAYARRFPERPASLQRALALGRIPFSFLPSGWVWGWLRRG